MKKFFLLIMAVGCAGAVLAQSPDVTIKRGKATMDEAYYYELKKKAAAYDELQTTLNKTQRELNDANAKLKKSEPKVPKTFNDSASYAIGKDLYDNWQQQNLGINVEMVAQSMLDILNGTNSWNRTVMTPLLQRFQSEFEKRERKKQEEMMASLDKNKAEGAEFLKENAKNKDVKTTASGLQYKVVKKGNGKKPNANSTVKVHYTGTLLNGTKFDSSVDRGVPAEFPVGAVIAGWTEGLQLMQEGAKYIFYIPDNLAYGERPMGNIPPGSTLIFEVELIEVK